MAERGGGDSDDGAGIAGEEGGGDQPPNKDLLAACAIGLLAVLAIVFAARLPHPGTVYSAPGLLPILTGATLLVMAIALGVRALRHGGSFGAISRLRWRGAAADFENRRILLLVLIIVLYVAALDQVSFDLRLPTGLAVFQLSSYEVVSFPFLAVILWIFWRASVAKCALVSVVAVVVLASIFRDGFNLLLPGSG